MPEITNLDKLKINVLTKEQFRGTEKDPNQIYLITDEIVDTDLISDEDQVLMAIEAGLITPVSDENGVLFTDEGGKIYVL